MEKVKDSPITSGTWGDFITWEIYASTELPPIELITAVACVALSYDTDDGIVLTKNQRGGWEVLAGHIEPGETPDEAMEREALEEGGYSIQQATPIGYREITASQKPEPGTREANYPYPISYIAYYLARTDRPTVVPTGEEILESRTFSQKELSELVSNGQLNEIEHAIIGIGMQALAHLAE